MRHLIDRDLKRPAPRLAADTKLTDSAWRYSPTMTAVTVHLLSRGLFGVESDPYGTDMNGWNRQGEEE
jgi:hypothetical protein